ncbi:MAG: hypothetical protein RBR02_08460 [Desulfuromonadaceae bacterium]|nr:hypothetical protein [Desulfuromonadaceae bacterium]
MNKANLLRQIIAIVKNDHPLLLQVAKSFHAADIHKYEILDVC